MKIYMESKIKRYTDLVDFYSEEMNVTVKMVIKEGATWEIAITIDKDYDEFVNLMRGEFEFWETLQGNTNE